MQTMLGKKSRKQIRLKSANKRKTKTGFK